MPYLDLRSVHNAIMMIAIVTLVIGLTLSPHFDSAHSDENGIIEITQNITLLFAVITTLIFARQTQSAERSLWYLASGLFFVLFARELSWGAVLLPLFKTFEPGQHLSSRMLWYRPAITPFVATLLIGLIAYFIKAQGVKLAKYLLQPGNLPLKQGLLFLTAAVLTTAAEGKMALSLPFDYHTNLNIEELAELAAYLFMVAAAYHAKITLEQNYISQPLQR